VDQLIYGSGEWSYASFGTLRQIFYAIFLTDVVGLDARLASFAALAGIIWDAVNDPLVGVISDRVKTRWGRRRPFLLFFSIPFGLGFLFLWWAPPWQNQIALMLTVMAAYVLSDTFQTLVSVPYNALTPEITPDYDERTTLTGFRMFFNLLASLATAVAAPMIVKGAVQAGTTLQQGYITVAALFGGLAAIPFLLIFAVVRERPRGPTEIQEPAPFRETLRAAWQNIPFRFATGIYMLNWITFDLVALMLPFFLLYWVSQGDLAASVSIFGDKIVLDSVVLGLLLITAVVALPLWTWLSHRFSKRSAHHRDELLGRRADADPRRAAGQVGFILVLAILAGKGVFGSRFARCDFPRRARVGRAAHAPAPGGDLLRDEEFRPQNGGRAGDFLCAPGAWLVRISLAAQGSRVVPTIRPGADGHPHHYRANWSVAAVQCHRRRVVLSADARASRPHPPPVGSPPGDTSSTQGRQCYHSPEPRPPELQPYAPSCGITDAMRQTAASLNGAAAA
jgi:GPH family glycoside/pentoside/hexuronide:cation symporter